MGRRKNKAPELADVTASTPDKSIVEKKARQDEASFQESMLSQNQYSTGGVPVNDSDIEDATDEVDEVQQQEKSKAQQKVPPNAAAAPSAAKMKLPPIVVKQMPLDKLVKTINKLGVAAEYKLSRIGIKVMLHTKPEYDRVFTSLRDSKAEFFTHDIPGEKPFKAVIRGLPNINPKRIEAELKDRYKLDTIAVYPITRKDNGMKYPDSLFLVHFKKGTVTLNALRAIRSLHSVIVTWESYRGGHRDVTQCQRCLNFGHGTRNCNLAPRCCNCAEDHATADCAMAGAAADEAVEFKCANCGGAHQGSDKKCTKREDFKRIRMMASTSNQPGRKKEKGRDFRSDDYPQLATGRAKMQAQAPPQQAPGVNQWQRRHPPPAAAAQSNQMSGNADGDSLLTDDELVILVTEVLLIKRSCSTRAQQLRAVSAIISKYGN